MKRYLIGIFVFVLAVSLTGCLTVEKKIYTINLNKDGSGTMEILYVNIFSQVDEEDTVDQVVSEDFSELLTDYVLGYKLENEFEDASLVEKKLFEQNNQLWGKVVYKFDNYEDIGLYKYSKKCPYMFRFTSDEDFEAGNCNYNEDLNVVFWKPKKKTLKLTTTVSEPDDNDVSLLDMWKKSNE